jgi:hypothetical protein
MRVRLKPHVDGQAITSDQPARRVEQQGIGGPGIIEIDRGEQMPWGCAVRAADDRLASPSGIVKLELASPPDIFGKDIVAWFGFP